MKFWKMHGLGNDYVVIDNCNQTIPEAKLAGLAKKLCDRRFSVGADGLLLVFPSQTADVKMRIFNADGSEAEMCGNGIRCFARYCFENGIVDKSEFSVETLAGIKQVWLTLDAGEVQLVRVDMGMPNWNRKSLPMLGEGTCVNEDLQVDNTNYKVTCLSMGNPHCVTFVDNVSEFPVEQVGPLIENHKVFPNRANAGFAQVISKSEMKVRVWERGCGETLACGTGTCAAVAAANRLGLVNTKVTVHVLGGDLQVEVASEGLFLSGAAQKVYEGTLFGEP
ncbi:MAG: diaminopimelate epimerase [Candidatus Bathyarchaeota archaeon]|nr:diaminopimelate epimerase [Candidatus Bathyarchaeota archaeon]